MKRKVFIIGLGIMALAALAYPAIGMAAENLHTIPDRGAGGPAFAINTLWVYIAAILVIFMQVGFMFLEIGFSRGKNAGTIVAKILVNFSIAALAYYLVGFAFAFGSNGGNVDLIGNAGFLLTNVGDQTVTFPAMGFSNAQIEAKWLFQFSFAAVSLAIVWGSTLERIKFGVYIIYAVIFAAFIYPIGSHWVFGGGWLQANLGMQDFAGSTAVHLIGATGALAVLLLLGPRKGKFGADGKPRAIPGHNMPLFGLAALVLLVGWLGFNPGSGLGAIDGRFAEVAMVTIIAAASGVIGALITGLVMQKTIDIGMIGNGLIAALVAITAGSGYVENWAAVPIGFIGGVIVVVGVIMIEKKLDDPVGVLSAHGLAGIWGTLACGLFTVPALAEYNAVGEGGLFYTGSFKQLGVQALGVVAVFAFVFVTSLIVFAIIKATYGLRVSEAEEDAGLDIVEHGMYGYPEQFIPASELVGSGLPGSPTHASSVLSTPPAAPAGAKA
ncbi:MAG: ammonium transporter [Solirubrobacterales bacterium]|nr:ammonium transporter [Solirubrobacterales bacterium]